MLIEIENNLQRRNYRIAERAMSLHMHAAEWALLDQVSHRERRSPEDMLTEIGAGGDHPVGAEGLTSSIRGFLLNYWRDQAAAVISPAQGSWPEAVPDRR